MNRILVRTPNWIGDQILAYPFYQILRAKYPKAWITVVCPEWVRDIQFKGFVDEVLVIPRKKNSSFIQSFKAINEFSKKIRATGSFDLGIALPNSFGSALLLHRSGAKQRRGYDTDLRGLLLTQKINWDSSPSVHRSQSYVNLLQVEGIPDFEIKNEVENEKVIVTIKRPSLK